MSNPQINNHMFFLYLCEISQHFSEDIFTLIVKYHHSLMYTSFQNIVIDTLKSLKPVNLMRAN